MLIVLGVSLGASAIWSVLSIINKLTYRVPLNQQTTAMNSSTTPDRPWLDLAYQLAQIGLGAVPVVLALYLLSQVRSPIVGRGGSAAFVGLDWRRPGFDLGLGVALAAGIGIPGLGLYLLARAIGINTSVAAANLSGAWWTIPVLVLAAIQAGVLEEVIMNGYLLTRLRQASWGWPAAIATSALIRGTYHVYQGFGGFVGNAVMGVIFGLVFKRWRRVGPLVVAHTILDLVSFVGYTLAKGHLSWLQ